MYPNSYDIARVLKARDHCGFVKLPENYWSILVICLYHFPFTSERTGFMCDITV